MFQLLPCFVLKEMLVSSFLPSFSFSYFHAPVATIIIMCWQLVHELLGALETDSFHSQRD